MNPRSPLVYVAIFLGSFLFAGVGTTGSQTARTSVPRSAYSATTSATSPTHSTKETDIRQILNYVKRSENAQVVLAVALMVLATAVLVVYLKAK